MVLWFEAKKQRICKLPQNTLLAKKMTSPPLKTMSSAEQSPEPRESEAAQALSQLQTQQPEHSLVVAPAEDSSVPPSPHVSLTHRSDSSSIFSPALPAPGDDRPRWLGPSIIGPQSQELPSRSAKRTASPIGLRSTKSRRDGQGSQQPSDVPTSSTGAQPTPAPYQHASNRAPSRARARALASAGSRALPDPREPQAERRLAGRPRKNPPEQAYPGPFTGAPLHYGAGGAMMPPHPFHNTFKASNPPDLRSAGSPSSLDYREQVGASIPNDPSLAAQRSSLSQPQGFPYFAGHRTGLSRPPPGSSTPHGPSAHLSPSGSSIYTPWSPNKPPSSFSLPYGSPGVPIPPPPYQILPMPNSSRPQAPVKYSSATRAPDQSSSVEADGYMMIREAIPVALVREVVAIIGRGLPVNMRSETAYTYATPVQAYRVRDEFVKNWRPALGPLYEPMNKAIPKMPVTNVVGSFKSSDPKNFRKSLLHIGSKDQIYVHVALTDLSPENGFYTILRGSHQAKHPGMTPVDDWIPTPITLREGDAFVWRGDLSYLLSSNGGGKWQCMAFEWGPGMVDLTTE